MRAPTNKPCVRPYGTYCCPMVILYLSPHPDDEILGAGLL